MLTDFLNLMTYLDFYNVKNNSDDHKLPSSQLQHWDYEEKVCYIYGGTNKYTLISLFIKK